MSPFAAHVLPEVGTCNFFLTPHIAIPQLEGNTSAIAIPQLFKEMCSATANPQFWDCYFFEVRNLRASLPQFSAYFWMWNLVDSWKKNQRWKISCYFPVKARFWRETDSSKYIFSLFFKPSWAEEKGLESSGAGQETAETCGIAEVKFWGFAVAVPPLF
jgi:hypothetical protein